jgi:hypothetical protein
MARTPTLSAQAARRLQHAMLMPEVQIVGGFVHQEIARRAIITGAVPDLRQRPGHLHPLLLAAGQGAI